MADTIDREIVGKEFGGGLDIDGVAYAVTVRISDVYSMDDAEGCSLLIDIPALTPWAADLILRAISDEYDRTVVETVG